MDHGVLRSDSPTRKLKTPRQAVFRFLVMSRRPERALLIPVGLLIIAACGGAATQGSPQPRQTPVQQPGATRAALATQEEAVPETPGLQIALASSDLAVGVNRMAFGLIDSQSGPLRDADVQVSTFHLTGGGREGPIETVPATFRKWPVGPGGVYTARLSFDRSGAWGIAAIVADGGPSRAASTALQVSQTSATPALGSPAPSSANKTARDVTSLEELTTDADPDPDLYAMTIAEAIKIGVPLLVVFATPAYCQTFTCGPQVEVIKALKAQYYKGQANFIHVEVYDNPLEIQGDLSRGRLSPTLAEWGLPSEPWTFILDSEGLVSAKFEGFATAEELEEALSAVLR